MTVDIRPSAISPDFDPTQSQDACSADGIAMLADGRFQDALVPLRMAMALGDATPSTILNLAIAEDRSGSSDHARRLMRRVAARLPDWDEPVVRLAESLRAAGDYPAAEEAYRQVLSLNPRRIEALIALSGLLLKREKADEARDLLIYCCGIVPDNAEAWNTLGLALRMSGAPSQALSAFVRAQGLSPDSLDYALNGAHVAQEAREADAELARLSVACDQNPLNLALQVGRGTLLDLMGRRIEAIDVLEAATELAPKAQAPLWHLGRMLARSNANRTRQAEAVLRRVFAMDPDNAEVGNHLATVLIRLHRHAEARSILQDIIDRHGQHSSVMCNLAVAALCLGLQDGAAASALDAIRLDPNAVLPRRTLCNVLPYHADTTGTSLLAAMRECSAVLPRSSQPALANRVDPDRPLVVGLLSGSLKSHPVGWLTVAGFETLDAEQFSLICLAQETLPKDPITRRFRAAAREWVEVDSMADAALLEAARSRNIDILIDLGGYGDGGRMIPCANRLAPVQIKWVGMQSHSSGLAEMDWFLTDRWETPDGFEPFYSEKLLRLPDGYVCYSPPPHAPDVVELPALSNRFITFGCFNNLAKITPRVIETWAAILRQIPTARLILKTHQLSDGPTADGFRAAFTALGIAGDRIELRGSSGHRAFMGQYGHVDIVLDPFPYSGGLTTCEALWMGVPTITLPGEIFASRHSASHMSNAGLSDWVASSTEDYIAQAVARTADVPALAALRARLRDQVRLSPLTDAPRFGRNLGAALRRAWRDWCAEAASGS
ncbi:MAG: tetratricopeptide repeat protein [Rhodopila sp.]